jgi:hypothetical protein
VHRFSAKLQEGIAAAEKRKEEEKEVAIAAVKSECALAVAAAQSEKDEYLALYTKVPNRIDGFWRMWPHDTVVSNRNTSSENCFTIGC